MTPLKLLPLLLLSLTASAQNITSPQPGTAVPNGATTTFTWNPGTSSFYFIQAGSSGCYSAEYGNPIVYTNSLPISIPAGVSGTLSIVIYGYFPGWSAYCYQFPIAGAPTAPTITSPANGSTVTPNQAITTSTASWPILVSAGTSGAGSCQLLCNIEFWTANWSFNNGYGIPPLPTNNVAPNTYIRVCKAGACSDYVYANSPPAAPDPNAGVNGSQFISATGSQVVPPNDPVAYAGMKFTLNVTFKNTGTRVWIANDPVKPTRMAAPGWENTWTYGYDPRSYMAPGTLVYPNQSYTFSKEYTAPSTPGVYNLNIQMVQDAVAFFGAIQTWSITVVQAPIQPTEFTAFPALPPETVADEFTGGTTLMRSLENPGTQLLAENSANHPIYGDAAVKQTDTFHERAVGLQPGSHFYVLLVRMKLDGSGTEAIPKPAAYGPVSPPGSPWWCYTWAQECETPPSGWGGIPLLWAFGTVNAQGQASVSGNYGNLEPSRQMYIEDWVVVNAAGQTVHLKNAFFVTYPSGDLPL